MGYSIAGNFREAENFTIFAIECQVRKICSRENFFLKISAQQVEKAKCISIEHRIQRQRIDFVVEAPSKLRNFFFGKVTYTTINSTFITANANGSSEFPLAWKFIANSCPHALISVLGFCDRLNAVVQACDE